MIEHVADQIFQKIEGIEELYYRLILLVINPGNADWGGYDILANQLQSASINVNLELGQRLLSLTPRQRMLKAGSFLSTIVKDTHPNIVLLTNNHILFDPLLCQDPLKLLQNLSRRKTIIAVWEGQVQDQYLTYAKPDHPEYRRYPAKELIIINSASNI